MWRDDLIAVSDTGRPWFLVYFGVHSRGCFPIGEAENAICVGLKIHFSLLIEGACAAYRRVQGT